MPPTVGGLRLTHGDGGGAEEATAEQQADDYSFHDAGMVLVVVMFLCFVDDLFSLSGIAALCVAHGFYLPLCRPTTPDALLYNKRFEHAQTLHLPWFFLTFFFLFVRFAVHQEWLTP